MHEDDKQKKPPDIHDVNLLQYADKDCMMTQYSWHIGESVSPLFLTRFLVKIEIIWLIWSSVADISNFDN